MSLSIKGRLMQVGCTRCFGITVVAYDPHGYFSCASCGKDISAAVRSTAADYMIKLAARSNDYKKFRGYRAYKGSC